MPPPPAFARPVPPAPPARRRRTRNPVARWWRAVRDEDATVGRRLAIGLSGVVLAGLLALAGGALALGLYAYSLLPNTPDAFTLARATQAQPTVVLAANGQRLTQFEPDFQEWVPLDSIPTHLVDALIATEDRRFYEHGGIDVRRTVGALWRTAQGTRQGGSTITQQLARNLFPDEIGASGTIERKLKEMVAARRIERDHTKREILEAYLNTTPFLYNAFGVEMAARTYFGTHAPALTVPQSATLVGMLKGPNVYNPVRRPEASKARRDLVLALMAQQGDLSAADARAFQAESLRVELRTQPSTYSAAPFFTAAVRRELEAWAQPRGYDLDRDGLVVWTTLDPGWQKAAEAAVAERAETLQQTARREWKSGPPSKALDAALQKTAAYERARDRGLDASAALAAVRDDRALVDSVRTAVLRVETALVAIQPETGAVRAYVGSRDFAVDEYDHAGVARRQPGSTFKPFVYAGALQRGYAPQDEIDVGDASVDLGDGRAWRPAGGRSSGTLTDALAYSKNGVTAALTQEIGPHRVALVAQRLGVTTDLDIVPSIGLGTSPVTLLEMVSAYGTIANDGLRRVPRFVTRVETAGGTVLATFGGEGDQALTRRDARNLISMMRAVVDRGTATSLRAMGVEGDLAGKTGTSQRYADGWFIGMRPGVVVGAWVGFNDQRVTFRSKATGEGSRTALPVVGAFLRQIQDGLPNERFPDPPEYGQPVFAADDDSTFRMPPDVAAADGSDYEWSFGEDPADPAPRAAPSVSRPAEDRPRLRSDDDGRSIRPAPPDRRPDRQPAPDRGRVEPVRTAPPVPAPRGEPGGVVRVPTSTAPAAPAPPAATNPNNAGGMSAEEIIERARRKAQGDQDG